MVVAVVSYHTNPYTCGVARFNHSLASALGVPVVPLDSYLKNADSGLVLLSIKLEEIGQESLAALGSKLQASALNYDVFLHAIDGSQLELELLAQARRVFAASGEIADRIHVNRPDVTSTFAPGAPVQPRLLPADCTLLTFGMAHKIRSDGYRRLATLLEGDSRSFRLEISTALHEGSPFDASLFTIGDEISAAFSGSVRFLGFLADAEVSERLREVDALIAFFPRGVRENNTTVLSAMSHGCPVVTNLDDHSPSWMIHAETVFDLCALTQFPTEKDLRSVGRAGMRIASKYSFANLAAIISDS
jgi:hypothetical protein